MFSRPTAVVKRRPAGHRPPRPTHLELRGARRLRQGTGGEMLSSSTSTTAGEQAPTASTAPRSLVGAVRQLEEQPALDRPVAALTAIADRLLASPRTDAALRGAWLGHALHPLLTDFPLGAWTSTSLLDLFGGRRSRPAATGLLAFGVVTALPTAAAGLAEWRGTAGGARRIGLVHAAVNTTALLLYTSSLAARLRGRQGRACLLSVSGGIVATAGGYLGGHLSLVRKVGTADPRFATEPASATAWDPSGSPPPRCTGDEGERVVRPG
jgi:uncharacterized membrane protein